MNKKESAKYKELLLTLKARIRGDVEQLTDEALMGHDGAAGQNSPTHIAELGTDAYEQDFALRFVENDQEVLEEIEAALERIEDGTYGICESCKEAGRAPSKSKAEIRSSLLDGAAPQKPMPPLRWPGVCAVRC